MQAHTKSYYVLIKYTYILQGNRAYVFRKQPSNICFMFKLLMKVFKNNMFTPITLVKFL